MNGSLHLTSKQLLLLSCLLFFVWLVLVVNLTPVYTVAVESNALAMIDILFPYYWIILIAFVFVCFYTLTKDRPRWLHIVLLAQLALMLFYTPFIVGGFSWSPDSLWHAGVARYMGSLLNGSSYPLTDYSHNYPSSFLVTWAAGRLLHIDVVTYTLYVFPPICITLISSLAYFFISRISSKSSAFLAMLIALPALHYIEPHVSPFATGTVLLFLSLSLLTYVSVRAVVANVFVIVALVLTHPISPIFLGVYLASVVFAFLVRRKFFLQGISRGIAAVGSRKRMLVLPMLLVFLLGLWVFWTFFMVAPNYAGVETPVASMLNLSFIRRLVNAVEWTAGGQGFIYPQISQLSLFIYAVFLLGVLLVFAVNFFKLLLGKSKAEPSVTFRLELATCAIISAVMSYLLFSSSGERFLLGRGLIFLLIMGAACIASYLQAVNLKCFRLRRLIALVFVLFLVCSFPVIAYSKEAYNTFTPPAEEGLVFLADNIDLSQKTVSMTSSQQLAAFADLPKGLNLIVFPPNITTEKPDVVVLRINSFYFMAMRYDGSFTNNSYIDLSNELANNSDYGQVFSNSQCSIYVKQT